MEKNLSTEFERLMESYSNAKFELDLFDKRYKSLCDSFGSDDPESKHLNQARKDALIRSNAIATVLADFVLENQNHFNRRLSCQI